jgi:hypothetical protein
VHDSREKNRFGSGIVLDYLNVKSRMWSRAKKVFDVGVIVLFESDVNACGEEQRKSLAWALSCSI